MRLHLPCAALTVTVNTGSCRSAKESTKRLSLLCWVKARMFVILRRHENILRLNGAAMPLRFSDPSRRPFRPARRSASDDGAVRRDRGRARRASVSSLLAVAHPGSSRPVCATPNPGRTSGSRRAPAWSDVGLDATLPHRRWQSRLRRPPGGPAHGVGIGLRHSSLDHKMCRPFVRKY